MPNKNLERFRVPREKGKDRRIKLSQEDKEDIRNEYTCADISQRQLARKWGVSRRLIQFTLYPKKYEQARKIRKMNGKKNNHYYDKEYQRKKMKEHRQHKKKLMEEENANSSI